MFYVLVCMIGTPYSLASCLIRFSCVHTCFPFASPRFVMHYPRCNTLAVRTLNCRLLRHFRDVVQTSARIADITLSGMTLAPAPIFCRGIDTRKRQRRSKRPKRSRNLGPYIPYGLFQTKGEMSTKFRFDGFRNVNMCKIQTNKQTHTHTNKQKRTKKLSALYIRYLCNLAKY